MRQTPLILAQYFTHMSEFTSQTRHDHEIVLRDLLRKVDTLEEELDEIQSAIQFINRAYNIL